MQDIGTAFHPLPQFNEFQRSRQPGELCSPPFHRGAVNRANLTGKQFRSFAQPDGPPAPDSSVVGGERNVTLMGRTRKVRVER